VDLNFALLYDVIDYAGTLLASASGSSGILPSEKFKGGGEGTRSSLEG
jgi:hypothetical protein